MANNNSVNAPIVSTNTVNSIVLRDSSGNFSAGTITANITGSSTQGTTVSTSTNASFFPLFVASSSNSNQVFNLGTGLTFNPSTNILSSTGLNLSSLSISSLIFTDSSKNLTSSQPANPQGQGLTGATSYGANRVIFQNSGNTAFSSASALTFNGADSFVLNSGNASSEIVSKNSNGGGGAEARVIIDRNGGGGNSGYAQLRYSTNSVTVWEAGIRDSSTDYTLRASGTNALTLTTGGTLTINGGPFSQGNFADGNKFLLLGNSNAAKISHATSWNFQFIAGAQTGSGTGSGPNTGQFNWYTVDGTGTAFSQVMRLSNGGNLSLLTGDFDVTRSSTGIVLGKISNTNNSNGSANARFQIITGGSSGGDPLLALTISSIQDWSVGVDNSASSQFVIAAADVLGTTDRLRITTAGDITNVVGSYIIGTTGKTLNFTNADADKVLFLGASTLTKIDTVGTTLNIRSGNSASPNTGSFAFYTSGASGWTSQMTLSNGGNLSLSGGDFDATRSTTGQVIGLIKNTNNANSTAGAKLQSFVGGASAGDPVVVMTIGGVQDWGIGVDNSVNDQFVIATSDTPGSGDKLRITTSGDITNVSGNLIIDTAGKTLKVKQGSNACFGTGAVLSGGTVTVNTTAVNTGDTIFLSCTSAGGTQGIPRISAIVDATSFTITSSSGTDTSTYSWLIIKAS